MAINWLETAMFGLFGALTISMAIAVVAAHNPLRSALALIVALCALAVLFMLLEAPFVAAMQILVYAGAIMVLFLFVIMLLNLGPGGVFRSLRGSWFKLIGAGGAFYLVTQLVRGTLGPYFSLPRVVGFAGANAARGLGSVRHVGYLLLTEYLFAFEAVSVLLLVAVVGAVVLGMKRLT